VSFAAALAWSALRAVLIAVAALPVCIAIANWWGRDDERGQRWRWLAVAGPFLFPELLVGYAYAPWVAGRPVWAEIACVGLLFLRLIPVGVVAWRLTPPSPVTPSALHCQQLLLRTWSDRFAWLRLWIAGPVLTLVPTFALLGLLAFQQFELAALIRAVSWSDWLFVQQVGGLSLTASLQAALWPAVGQLGIIVIGLAAVVRRRSDGPAVLVPARHDRLQRMLTGGYLAVAWAIVVGWPALSLFAGLPAGLRQLAGQPLRMQGLARELFAGLSAAVFAAVLTWRLSQRPETAGLHLRGERLCDDQSGLGSPCWRYGLVGTIACLPGLCGSLLLGLTLVALFQTSPLHALYNTPLPWIIGLVLYLLPRAVLLQAWVNATRTTSAEFLAAGLAASPDSHQQRYGRRLQWRLIDEPRFLAVALLAYWAYLDLTTAYLLMPTGLTSGVVRLYNFMHFGRTAALSAEAAVLLLGPLAILAAIWPLVRKGRT
jgi:hypothetical protein